MDLALVNGPILTARGFEDGLAVIIRGAAIGAVVAADDPALAGIARHDLQGSSLAPGLIDCQVNGGGGVLFNDAPDVDTIRRIGAAHARFGTTGFLPTLISDDQSVMRDAIAAVDSAISEQVPGVLGVHLEGPYLAPARRGIHNAEKFISLDPAAVELLASLRQGSTLVTLAPERVELARIHELVKQGVIVAAGHTAADYEQTRAALTAGVRGFTHLFNAMTPLGSREPGVVGAALDGAASWCGVIVDGHHLHPAVLRIALAAKPHGKIFLVTDAMPPVGSERDSFELNGERITSRNGRCENANGTLAGSALDMIAAVRNTVAQTGIDLAEALRMGSTYPAQFLGIDATHGRIAPGCRADFIVIDADLQLRETWISGERVYRA